METATVVSTPATWLPDDDILLKSAVEEGASLEALAKGAVPFSRTFTLQEVRDRWYALLYDPEISAQACRHLCPDESNKPEEIKANHRKRKVGTLRKRYHERVKKIRDEFFTSADLGFLAEPNHHNGTSNGSAFQDGPQDGNAMLGDCMADPFGHQVTDFDIFNQGFPQGLADIATINGVPNGGNAFHSECQDPILNKNDCLRGFQHSLGIVFPKSFHGGSTDPGKCLIPGGELSNNSNVYTMDFSPPQPSLPLWKSMEDEVLPNFPVNVLPADKTHIAQDVSELPGNSYSKGKRADKRNGDSFINSASVSDAHFDDLPDTLFEDEDKLFMDVNGNYQIDKSCCDNTLSGMPMDIDTLKIGEKAKVVATEPDVASYVEVQASSAPTSSNKPLERSPGIWHCVLNTEDPDIPCNDDIFLLIHPDAPNSSSAMTSNTKSATDPVSAKEKNSLQVVNAIKRREELAQSSKHSLMLGSFVMPEIGHVHSGGGITARTETNNSCKDPAPRHKAVVDPTQCKPAQTSLVSAFERNLEKNPKKVDSGAVKTPAIRKGLTRHKETGGVNVTHPEPEVNRSISDQEGPENENEDLHFSDIEAMVLDEDLQPYDVDLYFTRKVSKYQQENYKKIIMRLEQCARASIQRAMTSKGAIAVLYGRRSRHFIRKKEVLLGRSTEESVVDIDLGKEGRHNKISRRQAIVRMEDDGSFSLQNLAKNPMLVNGAEVGSRELVALSSSCVIEVRGINFMFESNQKYVKRYLENIGRRKQGQVASFKRLMKQEVS